MDDLRAQLARVDDALVDQLLVRQALVDRLVALKRARGIAVYDPEQEARVLARLSARAPKLGPLLTQVWAAIFAATRGPRG